MCVGTECGSIHEVRGQLVRVGYLLGSFTAPSHLNAPSPMWVPGWNGGHQAWWIANVFFT